jgi:2,3-bisphosphoglycerate-independent phosphoglycerate mutase
LGVGFDVQPGDLGVRLNFATVDSHGNITDRRAGRLPTEENERLLAKLRPRIRLPGVEFFLLTEKEYRAVLVLRGQGLSEDLTDGDPQVTGVPPRKIEPRTTAAKRSADLLNSFAEQASRCLSDEKRANAALMRGYALYRPLPTFEEVYGLNAAAIATYPMYRGLAKLVGMKVYAVEGTIKDEIDELENVWAQHDFFFVHFKYTDSRGEDGDFDAKVKMTELADAAVPRILGLKPDVLCITGDHSTPARLKSHSWHPIPVLIHAPYARTKRVSGFGETECSMGTLGTIRSAELMPLLLAHAGKLEKFGA